MAGALSVKMVGLFLVALVGLYTAHEMWTLLDYRRNIPTRRLFQHFWSRFLGLAVLPLTVYFALYAVHLMILTNSGPGDAFMSAAFQSKLRNTAIHNGPRGIYLVAACL